ncbi:MAG: hypothetical protein ACOC7K_00970 [bacterium]
MKRIPTDLKILETIYERYFAEYCDYSEDERSAKIYVPIDIDSLAHELQIEPDLLFGRLYYHLEHKYGYEHEDGTKVPFFALRSGDDIHCVNFPYMSSVLADLQHRFFKSSLALSIAAGSLLVSGISLVISLLG